MTTVCGQCGASHDGQPAVCAACGDDPLVGGRYALLEVIGRGGSGVTWRARRHPDGVLVCMKELRWDRMGSLDDEERFQREAGLLKMLDHARIPRYLDELAWPSEGPRSALWLAQELVDGPSLESERTRRRYSFEDILQIGEQIAEVCDYLESCRPPVVHRDIKPGNIMRRRDGTLVLVDFGAARAAGLHDSGRATVAGTFGTMAPEQLRGEASNASDIYGLAMTLASLFAGAEPEALLDTANRPDLGRIVRLPPGLRALFEDMLAVTPSARPSAREVRSRIAALRRGERAPARVPEPVDARVAPRPPASKAGRNLGLAIFIVAFAIIGIVGFTILQSVDRAMSSMDSPPASVRGVPQVVAATPEPIAPAPAPVPEPEPEPEIDPAVARAQALDVAGEGCARGEHAACETLWRAYSGDQREAMLARGLPKILEAACDHGDAESCGLRGTLSFDGAGVAKSDADGRAWYVRACEAGSVDTCSRSGRMLIDGEGGRIDAKTGVAHLQRACDAGNEVACMNIGVALARGQGIPVDRERALIIFEKACASGQSLACQNLDGLVGNDWGLPHDAKARFVTLTRLCDAKIGTACVRAGDAAKLGRGTPKDAAAALDYWRRGCNFGVDEGCRKAPPSP